MVYSDIFIPVDEVLQTISFPIVSEKNIIFFLNVIFVSVYELLIKVGVGLGVTFTY